LFFVAYFMYMFLSIKILNYLKNYPAHHVKNHAASQGVTN
jgi:hypothetical protein